MSSRVLLFGSSGFIGAHVRAALGAEPGVTELISPGRGRYDLVEGDRDGLIGLLREIEPDAVICCVGRLGGTNEELIRANTLVAAKLLDAVEAAAPQARLVRLGSAGEYGVVEHGRAVTENDPTEPIGAYGISHLAGTRLFTLAGETGRVDAISVRVFNPIGPGQSAENVLGRAQLRLKEAALLGSAEIVLGPLGAYRDFVDVRDLAAVLCSVVLTPNPPSRVYNAGSGQAVTVRSAVQLLAEQAGFTGTIREHGTGPQRSAAVDWIQADIGRAADELGWVPSVDLATSIKDIWASGAPG